MNVVPGRKAAGKVLLTGAGGLLGGAVRAAWTGGVAGRELVPLTRTDADLSDLAATERLLRGLEVNTVIHCAADVGGIGAHSADAAGALLQNVRLDSSLIGAALSSGVRRLVYFGSAAMYPVAGAGPVREDELLSGPFADDARGYGLAKATGSSLCLNVARERGLVYRVLVAPNLYGFGATTGVVASAVRKVCAALQEDQPSVGIWGDGSARREFVHADDLARFVVDSLDHLEYLPAMMNAGAGSDHSVADVYRRVADAAGYRGSFTFETSRPAGAPRRLLDSSLARSHGWRPATTLEQGIENVVERYASVENGVPR